MQPRFPRFLVVVGALSGGLSGACAGSAPQHPTASAAPATELSADTPAAPSLPPLPPGHVWREQVMRIMSPGLGSFLQRLQVHESLVDGAFHGFQIEQLRGDPSFWQGVDLRPGDVVTSVNGHPIGRDDQAYREWQSLATASSIVISYERAGQQRQLRYEIHDAGDAGNVAPESSAKPAGK